LIIGIERDFVKEIFTHNNLTPSFHFLFIAGAARYAIMSKDKIGRREF